MKTNKNIINYLNRHREELFAGKVSCYGLICWANMTTREVYAHSVDEEIAGSISGYKIANIAEDWTITI